MGASSFLLPPISNHVALRARLDLLCRTNGSVPLAPQPSGFANLDAQLPGGGWPIGALTECLLDTHGIGELSLWMPALRILTRAKRYLALIAPPFVPYAPALVQHGIPLEQIIVIDTHAVGDSLWVTEQTLRCAAFGAVLAWPSSAQSITDKQLRRLQLAAEAGRNLGVLYRPLAAAQNASPAALRLKLQADKPASSRSLQVTIHKCRGGHSGAIIHCALERDLQIAGHAA
jgi:hypothetical protein